MLITIYLSESKIIIYSNPLFLDDHNFPLEPLPILYFTENLKMLTIQYIIYSIMPTFIDFHSMGQFNEEDLQKFQLEPRDEHGVKTLNIYYDLDSGMMFCLLDAPDKKAVELHHLKIRIKCDWITRIKMTENYQISHEQDDSPKF